MEQKLNIAEILRNKPHGIRLYSPIFGDCTFCYIKDETIDICVRRPYNEMSYFNFEGLYNTAGECLLFPSRLMRNWSKFAWKKGDVLVSDNGKVEVIFEKFVDDTYQSFIGKHHLDNLEDNLYYQDEGEYLTSIFNIESEDAAQTYIKTIEEKLGGKLNSETLEIEKDPASFKDGDIVVTDPSRCHSKCIFILKGGLNACESHASSYVFYNIDNNHISFDIVDRTIRDRNIHLATVEEELELFDALTKEGKYWDAEKKQIVDLSKKYKFKPFDKVLGRNTEDGIWEAEIFSHYEEGSQYPFRCVGYSRKYCIPYNENTKHLLGTTNNLNKYEG